MRRLLAAAAVAASVTLGGCGTTGGFNPGPVVDVVNTIRNGAVSLCGFEPALSTISGLWSVLGSIDAVIKSVCDVVGHPTLVRGGGAPRVHGVAIRGRFVRR